MEETMPDLIEIEALDKRYAGVQALDNATLRIRPGEVHGLVGENGAGKSTLIKILAGAVQRDSGIIRVGGDAVDIATERDADALGLRFIHQDVGVVDRLTVAENLFLGRRLPRVGPFVSRKQMYREARVMLEGFADVDPATKVSKLSIAQRWMVGISRACYGDARLIVMDEPTVALSDTEVELVFDAVDRLKAAGIAVLFVSHRLAEIMRVSDRVTVMKDGRTAGTHDIGSLDQAKLVRLIVGELGGAQPVAVPSIPQARVDTGPAEVILEVVGLSGGPLKSVNVQVRGGEVLGIAGLVGSGRSSLLAAMFGAHRPTEGEIRIDGQPVRLGAPTDAVKRGIAMIPEERRAQGLLAQRGVRENVVLTHMSRFRWMSGLPLPLRAKETKATKEQISALHIATSGPEQKVSTLSGGNQQKALFARWLIGAHLRVLLLDEPTKGIDVGAKAELFRIVRRLADDGVAVVLVSSDLEEVGANSDRIVVLAEGQVVAEMAGPAPEPDILDRCYSHRIPA
jgi:ABC-type sugar transport system ATPase subunit